MKRNLRRVLFLLVCTVLCCGLAAPALAVKAPSISNDESITKTNTTTLTKMEQSTYYTQLIGEVNREIVVCQEELNKDIKDAGAILKSYAKIMILMDWVTSNFYVEGPIDDPATASAAYTLFEVPGNITKDSNSEAVALMKAVNDLRVQLQSCDVFNTEVDWSTGKFQELSQYTTYDFGMSEDVLTSTSDGMIGRSSYKLAASSIVSNYIEGKILAILIQGEDSLADLRGETISPSVMGGRVDTILDFESNPDAANAILQKYKEDLAPYLTMFNEIQADYSTQRNIGLEDFSFEGKEYVACHYTAKAGIAPPDALSSTSHKLWELMFAANSDNTIGDINDIITTFNTNDSALELMSNCRIVNNAIMLPTAEDPELTKAGYAILASGATYDPFVSKACDDPFMSVVTSFLESEESKDKLIQILQVAANTKKPLYVTEGGKSEWKKAADLEAITIADYHWATLKDVLEIDRNITKGYAILKGHMTPTSVDSSTWEYSNYGTQNGNPTGTTTNSVTVTDPNAPNSQVSNNTTQGATYNAVSKVGSVEIQASSQQITMPIMITSGRSENFWTSDSDGFPAAVGGMTSLIIHNAAVDAKGCEAIQRAEREMLFVNGLGDIVLSDNTIVLPAIANPLMYHYDDTYTGVEEVEDFMKIFSEEIGEYKAYYPYTAAFMNHYPIASVGADGKLEVSSANDLDKYLICVDKNVLYAKRIKAIGDSSKLTATGGVVVSSIYGSSFRVKDDDTQAFSVLNIARGKAGFNWHNVNIGAFFVGVGASAGGGIAAGVAVGTTFGGPVGALAGAAVGGLSGAATGAATWAAGLSDTLMITRGAAMNGEGISFFPLNTSTYDVAGAYQSVAAPLATSALRFISTTEEVTGQKASSGRFRISHYLEQVCGEAMLGTQYAETLDKTFQVSYEDLVNDSGNRFLKFLTQLCESAIENLGRIDGVLAIKGPYANSFFNMIVRFVQQFYLLIAAGLMIIVAAKFMKGHYNMLYVCFLGVLCIAGFEVYANWMPTLIPGVYNFAVNDAIEDIVWSTVAHQAEQYEETYRDSNRVDPATGYTKPYTATITLYTLSNEEMESICVRANVPDELLRSGTQIFLDADAGIYVQGNQIKMSVDRLLVNNSMRGLYQSQWETLGISTDQEAFIPPIDEAQNNNPYSIQITGGYISLEAYYTPFDHIERAFMVNLNTFSNIFRIERNQYPYANGEIYKDAFLVQAYLHSGLFYAPGDDAVLFENIIDGSVLGGNSYTAEDIIRMCNEYFQLKHPAFKYDWMNLRSIFMEPDTGIQNSLWGVVMQNRNWYDANWQVTDVGEKELSELMMYINNQTKVWVINNEQQLNYLSDENALKMISLYATTCFTHYISQFGSWVYPNYINAADLELQDVLYGSMTTLRDRNHAYDGTIVNTVALNLGIFGVIFLILIVLFATIFVFVITYLIPVLYALFGGILIFKLINDTEGIGLVKGYVKVTGISAVLYFIFSLSLKLVRIGGYNWYGYLGCAFVMLLCLYFLFWVCLSIVQDVGELGNNTLKNNLLKGLDKITRGAFSKMAVNTTHIYQGAANHYTRYGGARRFGRGYNVDDYGMPVGSRAGYGRYGGQDNYDYGRRTRTHGFGRGDYYDDDFSTPRRGLFGRGRANSSVIRRGWFGGRNRNSSERTRTTQDETEFFE